MVHCVLLQCAYRADRRQRVQLADSFNMGEQSEPFLGRYSSDEEELKSGNAYEKSRQSSQWYSKRNLYIHAALILLYTLISLVAINRQATSVCKNDIQSKYL